jgi:hypothetical protein
MQLVSYPCELSFHTENLEILKGFIRAHPGIYFVYNPIVSGKTAHCRIGSNYGDLITTVHNFLYWSEQTWECRPTTIDLIRGWVFRKIKKVQTYTIE